MLHEIEGATGATFTAVLGEDHRRLDGLLADAKRALRADEIERASALFSTFRDGLERHIVAEEEVLIPAFETLTGVAAGPTRVMRAEHAEIRALLRELGSLRAVREATPEQLASVTGISPADAERIRRFFASIEASREAAPAASA